MHLMSFSFHLRKLLYSVSGVVLYRVDGYSRQKTYQFFALLLTVFKIVYCEVIFVC